MKIKTKFSNGDVVYCVQREYSADKFYVIGPLTIGQVRVEITNSPGVGGEKRLDNYKAQKGRTEQYMCVETGVGFGAVHHVKILFSSKEEAETEANARNAKEYVG